MRIDENKLEEVQRNLGVAIFTTGIVGIFLDYSFVTGTSFILVGGLFIFLGIKESDYGN